MRWIGLGAVASLCLGNPAAPQPANGAGSAKPVGAPPIYRDFHDWVLVCDNVRTCIARYVNPPGDGSDGYLSFSRDAGPAGAARVTLSEAAGGRVDLDGRSVGRYPWTPVARKGTGRQVVLEDDAALKFVRAIQGGRQISYNAGGSIVSLDGFAAAVAAMDEAQRQPAMDIPVVYARPAKVGLRNPKALSEAVRKAREAVLSDHDCDLDLARYDQAFALNGGEAVVVLGCDVGAYNKQFVAFLTPVNAPDQAKVLRLPIEPGVEPATVTGKSAGVYVGVSWDPGTATFSTRAKYRGQGDCGSRSAWTFDGREFQFTRYDKLEGCGGGPDGDWPTLYRAKVVVK
jgi:hypothetical protein